MRNNSYKDFEECNCKCHTNSSIKHIMACCWKCPNCGKHILFIFQNEHMKKCNLKQFDNIIKDSILRKKN